MSQCAIEAVGLTKDYGGRRGLDQLDMTVEHGEVFGFLCPNGSGKSTTIRLMLDLLRPTAGTIRVFGADPASGPGLCGRIGYLPGELTLDGRHRVGERSASSRVSGEGCPPAASTTLPTGSAWTCLVRSAACPRATSSRSASSRPSCTSLTCSSSTSRRSVWTRSSSRPSSPWSGKRAARAGRCSCPLTCSARWRRPRTGWPSSATDVSSSSPICPLCAEFAALR